MCCVILILYYILYNQLCYYIHKSLIYEMSINLIGVIYEMTKERVCQDYISINTRDHSSRYWYDNYSSNSLVVCIMWNDADSI